MNHVGILLIGIFHVYWPSHASSSRDFLGWGVSIHHVRHFNEKRHLSVKKSKIANDSPCVSFWWSIERNFLKAYSRAFSRLSRDIPHIFSFSPKKILARNTHTELIALIFLKSSWGTEL